MPEASAVMLVHDEGELDAVASALRGLGIPFEEVRGAQARSPILLPRDLLVASAQRALKLPAPPSTGAEGAGPARLAVGPSDSQGLRAGLRLAGFHLLVREPVHPTALRLLLLRLLYRGPERRGVPRVSVGLPTRFRRWLRWRDAVLTEISAGGCRLLVPREIAPGRNLAVEIPEGPPSGRSFRVTGRVIRSNGVGPTDPSAAVAVTFAKLRPELAERLAAVVRAHASGPASFSTAPSGVEPSPSLAEPTRPALAEAPSQAPLPAADEAQPQPGGRERRVSPRTRYRSRVVTLGEQAAHVVLGRDLSAGGIRIEPHGALEPGQALSVALHGATLPVPLVVRGRVTRDDGEAGLLLQFDPLSPAQQAALAKLMAERGAVESLEREGASIVTELLPAA